MRKIVLRIENAAFEKFMGIVDLCPQVEVIDTDGHLEYEDDTTKPLTMAIKELEINEVSPEGGDVKQKRYGT